MVAGGGKAKVAAQAGPGSRLGCGSMRRSPWHVRGRMPIRPWWRQRQRLCARPTKRHAHERVQGMKWWWATEVESSMALNQKITHQAISGIVSTGAGHHMTAIGMSTLREAVPAME